MLPPLPRAAAGCNSSLFLTQPCQPSPEGLPGRPAHRPFRGLLSVYSRCGLHTRGGHQFVTRYPKASDISSPPCLLRLLPAGANQAGWGLHPLESAALSTAQHPEPTFTSGLANLKAAVNRRPSIREDGAGSAGSPKRNMSRKCGHRGCVHKLSALKRVCQEGGRIARRETSSRQRAGRDFLPSAHLGFERLDFACRVVRRHRNAGGCTFAINFLL